MEILNEWGISFMPLGENQSVLVYDCETDSLDPLTAKLKWFGAYSYKTKQYHIFNGNDKKDIKDLLESHKVLVSFNGVEYDNPILENCCDVDFNYRVIVDLYQVSKKRLSNMGIESKTLKLDDIISTLKLDEEGKGKIDYRIFQKDEWTIEEIVEIKKYLVQDINLTKKLLEWYFEQFKPLRAYLSQKDKDNYADIKASTASLAYRVICNIAGIPAEFSNDEDRVKHKIPGGHHIEPRKDRARGNIVSVDFVSAYPHAIMQGNLFSKKEDGWSGDGYYNLSKTYDNTKLGKTESALRQIFMERIKAKKEKDRVRNIAFKICINAIYGLTGNSAFKSLYNPYTASDCTSIVRTWMKKLAKTLEENGFFVLYGFTDSVMVEVPEGLNKNDLMIICNQFIWECQKHLPFPQETFALEIDKEMKFIWFVAKNCYLWIDKDNKIGYRSTLLDRNTPRIIMKLFNGYMSEKILREVDVNFTKEELRTELIALAKDNLLLCGEINSVKNASAYAVKSSLQYQIAEKYGEGRHLMIPNIKGIGVGKAKSTKNSIGVRYCTLEEFRANNLTIEDIDYQKMLEHLKPFYKKKEIRHND
jgi:DNA polymerase elongation subunit (family B)